jgi:hypothetical protein
VQGHIMLKQDNRLHFILLQHTQTSGKQPCEKLNLAQRKVEGGQQW